VPDNFYLAGAVRLLKESLEKLGSDAAVEIMPGKDHLTLLDAKMAARLDREMREMLERADGGKSEGVAKEAKSR
jgi:hypothetical protein